MVFNYGLAGQLFGARRNGGRRHAGIDLGTNRRKGVPVGCPIDGYTVASVKYRRGYGNTVDLVSKDGKTMMRFAHLANPLPKHLKVGEEVRAGDWLGNVGNTGGRYAIHLHFEFRLKKGNYNVPVNPFNNKIHTFCKADFESSTQKAYTSRKNIQAGMSLAETHAKMDRENTATASQPSDIWTLKRGYNQPTWWQKIAHPLLGGWTKEQLKEAAERQRLDEEIFIGIKRRDLLNAGLKEEDISKLRTHVQEKTTSDPRHTLEQKSVTVDFNELYDDKETAKIAHQFFVQHSESNRGNA